MTREQFEMLVDTFGGERDRWPVDIKADAEAFAATAAGAMILAQARELDRELMAAMPEIEQARVDRAIEIVLARTRPAPDRARSPSVPLRTALLRWLLPSAGFATAALVGVSLGVMHPTVAVNKPGDAVEVIGMIFDSMSAENDWMVAQ